MNKATALLAAIGLLAVGATAALADLTAQSLPFSQDWTNIAALSVADDWSGVPGVIGYRGDDPATTTCCTDPQTVLVDLSATPVDVEVDKADPNTYFTGGVAEFHITNPTVAVTGSGTADRPHLVLTLNTTGWVNIRVQYDLRDIESADNAVMPIALQYRVGTSGNYTNIAAGFVADATDANATLSTHVNQVLPAAADNQSVIQVRIMTYNAAGNDEWVGIDNISVTGEQPTPAAPTTWGKIKALYSSSK